MTAEFDGNEARERLRIINEEDIGGEFKIFKLKGTICKKNLS